MVIIYSTLLIIMGLLVDLLYAWLDPRVRLGE
jgi:ABC-type dipeptide/oligopeptide/nickel transport system permease component